jgi:hypothetical protein
MELGNKEGEFLRHLQSSLLPEDTARLQDIVRTASERHYQSSITTTSTTITVSS